MHSVAQFYQDCLSVASQQPPLDLLLSDAMGCVLAEDVIAPFDHPFVDVAACDGYAVASSDVAAATDQSAVVLSVIADVRPGTFEREALVESTAARIASGAPLPIGADAVIPQEAISADAQTITVRASAPLGQNVRHRAEDLGANTVVLRSGTRLGSAQIAALAAVGRARVVVHPKPRVIVISVGDELVDPGIGARPGAVFDANGHALAAAAAEAGVESYRVAAVPDDAGRLRDVIEDQLMRADLIITTGGLSSGSADTVRQVLGELGQVKFDEVAAWPGYQLGVGVIEQEEGRDVPVYCLPGDPVSAQVCFEVYVRPALRKMQGWTKLNRAAVRAAVDRGWHSPQGYREFVRVRLTGSPVDGYTAAVMGEPNKLWLSALASSNALAVIPEDVVTVRAGDQLTCLLLEQ